MRIFQIAPSIGAAGGVETYIGWLSTELIERGHETAIGAASVGPFPVTGFEVLHLPELAWREAEHPDLGRHRVLGFLRQYQPDCILVHALGDGKLLRMLAPEFKTVEFVHSFICRGQKLFRRSDRTCTHPLGWRCLVDWYVRPCGSDRMPSAAIASLLQAQEHVRALAEIDLVVVGSRFMKNYLLDEGLRDEQIEIVDMSMGLAAVDPTVRANGHNVQVVYVGRTVYTKGAQYLLKAIGQLGRRYLLTIIGDGWYRPLLEKLARDLGIEDRVHFTGALQPHEVRKLCQTATVAVVPSIYPEPTGLVVPEMRNLGLPVVVTRVGGLAEWVGEDPYVYGADAADVPSLVSAIRSATQGMANRPSWRNSPPKPGLRELLEALHSEKAGALMRANGA
jgi:glycosyltransferase involved in cell wall biosynthesis